eukprot:TRINITY_DN6971_c0_g1_i1.p1 TRINITY_DN6971_c0_g1~~TRINITY_DN6971_c0_g1_i1.p1  ORF type:complete len:304 (-),score=77.32 TRINITY_DN6971_c0_g1_i1:18-929(-)
MEQPIFAGVEMGGTSVLVAIAIGDPTKVVESHRISTTTPNETFEQIFAWLKPRKFDSIGIACFGPIDLDLKSPTYGYITTTPKPGWGQTDVVGRFKSFFNCPIGFDTDVNAAAIGHFQHGWSGETKNGKGCAYVTIGTGVGVGIVVDGKPLHGLLHPEAGHIFVPRKEGDQFEDLCPYHKNCLEGLVASHAIAKRKQISPSSLPELGDEDEVWEFFSFYVAQLCSILALICSPNEIVLGGGLMQRQSLFPKIRKITRELLNGYLQSKLITENTEKFIVPSPFKENAGIVGAFELARLALGSKL